MQGRFNANISHQLFDYTITFVNLQRENTNSKGDFIFKNSLKHSFQIFVVYRINLSQKYISNIC